MSNEPLIAWRNKGGVFFKLPCGAVYQCKRSIAVGFEEDDPLGLNQETQ